jgi:hypothetical protein
MLMKRNGLFDSGSDVGLVIVFPPTVKGLFNPRVHRLVRGVEARLGAVFVTYALSSGSSPDVEAALAAARFAGCSAAVVVHWDSWLGSAELDPSTDTLWSESPDVADLRLNVESVLRAFRGAGAALGAAA